MLLGRFLFDVCLISHYIYIYIFFFFFLFFSVRSNFIVPAEHQKQYFHEWRLPRVRICFGVHEWNRIRGSHEWKYCFLVFIRWNKIRSYTEKKIKFSVSFMLLFPIIKFYMLFDSRVRKHFFSSHFTSVRSCSACLRGMVLGENTVCGKIAFKQ